MQEKSNNRVNALSLYQGWQQKKVTVMNPYQLICCSYLSDRLLKDFIHIVVAAPKLFFAEIKFKVVQGFVMVKQRFYDFFMELKNLIKCIDWEPHWYTVVLTQECFYFQLLLV